MPFLQRKFTIIKHSNCPTVLIQVNRHQRWVKLLDQSELLISAKKQNGIIKRLSNNAYNNA